MKKTGSIKKKLLLIISLGIFIPMIIVILVSAVKFEDYSIEIAKGDAITLANEYGNSIQQKLNKVFIAADTYTDVHNANISEDGTIRFSIDDIHKMQRRFLIANNQALTVYTDFLPQKVIIPTGLLNENKVMIGDVNNKGEISYWENWNLEFKSDVIGRLKNNNGTILSDPYEDEIHGINYLMISYGREIKDGDEIIGLVGVDFSIDWIQEFINNASIFDGMADICIVSSEGIIVGNNNKSELVGTNVQDLEDCSDTEKSFFSSPEQHVIVEDKLFKFFIPIK